MTDPAGGVTAQATARNGTDRYAVDIEAGRHRLRADEPAADGGGDIGPNPFALVLSGLGACTAITLRMYAERKGWPLDKVAVHCRHPRDGDAAWIERELDIQGPLDESQRARLADIAEKTPVTRLVMAGAEIRTKVR